MLPFVSALDVIDPVTAADVGIAVEIVISIDVYVTAAPAAAPAPVSAVPVTYRHTNSKTYKAGSHISARWIINRRIGVHRVRIPVNNNGIVLWYINNFRVRLLDNDHFFALNYLGLNLHLFARLECSFLLSLYSHSLDRVHYVLFLR